MEGQARGLADQLLEPFGIAEAGNLHQNTVIALPLDDGLGGAHLVDTAADDFERLRHQRGHPARNRVFGQGDADAAARCGDLGFRGRSGLKHPALDHALKRCEGLLRCLELARIGQFDIERRPVRGDHAADSGIDQQRPRLAPDIVDTSLDDVVAIDLQQKMRAALQIQPENDFVLGEKIRHPGYGLVAQEIGQHRDDTDQRHEKDGD